MKRDTLFGLPVIALEEAEAKFPPDTHQAFVAVTYTQSLPHAE